MSESSAFVSVFKINGRPIIPPAMTPRRRKEMQEYKMKAVAIEQKLKEKKKEKRESASDLIHLDEDGNKENEETLSACGSINEDSTSTRKYVKSVLSERESLKELIPQFLQKSIDKSSMMACNIQSYGDYQEESYSVALTESTDLHPYLNSSLDDEICSSEAECSTCASAPKHTLDETCCNILECKCNSGVDIGTGFTKFESLPECTASHISDCKETYVMDSTTVISILDPQLKAKEILNGAIVVDLANSFKSSVLYKGEKKLLETDVEDNSNKVGYNYISFPSSISPLASLPTKDDMCNEVTALQKNSKEASLLNSCSLDSKAENLPGRLIRTESFTLDTPSPLLMANIEQFTVEAVVQDDSPSSIVENKTIDCHQADNPEELNTQCISPQRSLPLSSSEDGIDIHQDKRTESDIMLKTREASVALPKREPVKASIQRGSVFDRLAADASKRAEERRKLSRKSNIEVFKVPKKISKSSSRGIRPSVSASNLRVSLSGIHKKKSNALAYRRSNSEANVSAAHGKGVASAANFSQKQNTSNQVTSEPNLKESLLVNEASSVGKDPIVMGTSEDTKPLHIEKDLQSAGIPDEYTSAKPPAYQFIDTQAVPHLEKSIYFVQTSPISPPLPHQSNVCTGGEYPDGGETALQGGRRRRRWSVGWSGWVTSAVIEPESDSHDIDNSCSAKWIDSESEGWEASKIGLDPNFQDVSIRSLKGDLSLPSHMVQKSKESSENNVEIGLQSPDIMKSQEQIVDSNVQFLQSVPKISPENGNCDLEGDNVISDIQSFSEGEENESIVNAQEGAFGIIIHNVTPMPENCNERSVFQANLNNISNNSSLPSGETSFQSIKLAPSVEKTLNSLPPSPMGSVDIKETALKLLGRLVEEQDQAMIRLLEDQRQQAEKMKERFKMQQKCLVERVAHLVSSLSTPPSKKFKAPHLTQCHEDTILIHEEHVSKSKSPVACGQHVIVPQPSTPLPPSRAPEDMSSQPFPPACSSQLELSSQLRLVDDFEEMSSKGMVNELGDKLIKLSQKDLPLVENSFCQACLSIQSNCRCSSQEESSYSSTVREEITALSIGSEENVTVAGISDTKCNMTNDKTVDSNSPFQEENIMDNGNLTNSSVKPDVNVPVNLASMKTDFVTQEGVLDLSEILEMELGPRSGSNLSRTPHLSLDKSRRKSEEIQSITLLPTDDSVKTMNDSPTITPLEDLSSYRVMFEQDLQRLISVESNTEKRRDIAGLMENELESSMKDNLRSAEKRSVTTDEISDIQRKATEDEGRVKQFDILPDLRSDILQAYLGSQTPSTGPVFLQTPIASSANQCQAQPACSTPAELYANDSLNGLPPKEVQCENDIQSPALISPVIRESLECKESLDLSPNDLHISIRSSPTSSNTSFPRELSQPSSERHPSTSNSQGSGHYTTASSKCHSEDFNELEKNMLFKFGKLTALVKGYLTRRLLKTEKVRKIKMTIRDLMVTALKVHSEVSQEENVNPNDVQLHGQILAVLNATCEEFHNVFFEMTKAQQMAIISADRHRLMSSSETLAVTDAAEIITPRPALLSAVTLKTLQRRFSICSPKNCVGDIVQSRCNDKHPNQRVTSSIGVVNEWRMSKTIKGRELSSTRPTSRTMSISEDLNSRSVSRNVKTSKVPNGQTTVQIKSSRRKRRSKSAGEMKRKPWR